MLTGNSGPYRRGDIIAGKYELLRVISHGGMGWIWVAHHLTLQIETAIKLIRPDLRTETLIERFINEARVAAHVEHPGIVSIFDLGVTERGDPFIVMELLKGEDLRELLRRTVRLTPIRAVQLLLPVADAMATAHAQGIVHRDLKPENVFIVGLEQRVLPKIVDFGIAKPGWPCDRRLTRSGTVMGSPEYMSPEQALGREDIDQRVDVWSFCIVLYECLVGRPPFFGNYESTLTEILEKSIVPITELGIAEPALWTILESGLAKQREQRFQDMRSLGRALAEWLIERGVDEDVCAQSLRATWLKESNASRLDFQPKVEPAGPAASARLGDASAASRSPHNDAATLENSGRHASCLGRGSRKLAHAQENRANRRAPRFYADAGAGADAFRCGMRRWIGVARIDTGAAAAGDDYERASHAGANAVQKACGCAGAESRAAVLAPAAEPPPRAAAPKGRLAAGAQAPRRAKLPAELVFGF